MRSILYDPSILSGAVVFVGEFALQNCTNACAYNYGQNRFATFSRVNVSLGLGITSLGASITFLGQVGINSSVYGIVTAATQVDVFRNITVSVKQVQYCDAYEFACEEGTFAAVTLEGKFLFFNGSCKSIVEKFIPISVFEYFKQRCIFCHTSTNSLHGLSIFKLFTLVPSSTCCYCLAVYHLLTALQPAACF